MRWLLVAVLLCASCAADETRPKNKDASGREFVTLTDVQGECSSGSYFGYGISAEGGLEHCENKSAADAGDGQTKLKYQEFKCASLRVHGEMSGNECKCADKWKGPICNSYDGCLDGRALVNGVCSANVCQNGGTLSIGTTQIECSCPVPWDGRFCDRLACWRKASIAHERRWKNAGTQCACSEFYTGPNCDSIVKCKNGNLTASGYCDCSEGWMGEICDKKCYKGMECIQNSSWQPSAIFLSVSCLLVLLFKQW